MLWEKQVTQRGQVFGKVFGKVTSPFGLPVHSQYQLTDPWVTHPRCWQRFNQALQSPLLDKPSVAASPLSGLHTSFSKNPATDSQFGKNPFDFQLLLTSNQIPHLLLLTYDHSGLASERILFGQFSKDSPCSWCLLLLIPCSSLPPLAQPTIWLQIPLFLLCLELNLILCWDIFVTWYCNCFPLLQ